MAPLAYLEAALAPVRASASFETVVTLDGAVIASSSGRSIGDSFELSVVRDGRTVEYIQVPPNAWARDSGAAWIQLSAGQAPPNPIAVLGSPATVELADDGGSAAPLGLRATYPAAALGLTGEPVSVSITIDGDVLRFRYDTLVGDKPASSETVLRPATGGEPIVPPAT